MDEFDAALKQWEKLKRRLEEAERALKLKLLQHRRSGSDAPTQADVSEVARLKDSVKRIVDRALELVGKDKGPNS